MKRCWWFAPGRIDTTSPSTDRSWNGILFLRCSGWSSMVVMWKITPGSIYSLFATKCPMTCWRLVLSVAASNCSTHHTSRCRCIVLVIMFASVLIWRTINMLSWLLDWLHGGRFIDWALDSGQVHALLSTLASTQHDPGTAARHLASSTTVRYSAADDSCRVICCIIDCCSKTCSWLLFYLWKVMNPQCDVLPPRIGQVCVQGLQKYAQVPSSMTLRLACFRYFKNKGSHKNSNDFKPLCAGFNLVACDCLANVIC